MGYVDIDTHIERLCLPCQELKICKHIFIHD